MVEKTPNHMDTITSQFSCNQFVSPLVARLGRLDTSAKCRLLWHICPGTKRSPKAIALLTTMRLPRHI
jgi:hypothetical protein